MHMKNKHTFLKAWCAALLMTAPVLGVSQYAHAQTRGDAVAMTDVPRTISYQGLVNNGDKPVTDGKHSFTFTLYGDDYRQSVVWTGTYLLDTKDGMVNALLGSGNSPLPEATEMNKPLWLGVKVDNQGAEAALTQLSASAYALNVGDKSITTSKIANEAVTADKMGTNYVASISLNGYPITGVGSDVNIKTGPGLDVKYDNKTSTLELSNSSSSGSPTGPKVQWTGYNPGSNDDGSAGYSPNNDLTNTIGGGNNNQAFDPTHTSTSWHAAVLGGEYNYAHGSHSAIAGGQQLRVGNNSFGFNNKSTTTGQTDVSGISDIGYFGNVDLVVGNTDNAARALKLYAPNVSLSYGGGTPAKWSSFEASASQTAANIRYVLPAIAPSANQVLQATSSTTPYTTQWANVTATSIDWINVGGVGANAINANALQVSGTLSPSGSGIITANAYSGPTLGYGAGGTGATSFNSTGVIYAGASALTDDFNDFAYDATNKQVRLGGSGTHTNPSLLVDNGNVIQLSNSTPTKIGLNVTSTSGADVTYHLPATPANLIANNVLQISSVTGVGPYSVDLDWTTPSAASGAWVIGGNTITSGTGLLGTNATSTVDLALESKGVVLLSFDGSNLNILGGSGSAITGGSTNIIAGGAANTIVGGNSNTISGGDNNTTGTAPSTTAKFATISGGTGNSAHANTSTVGGGATNSVEGISATIAGGTSNSILANGTTKFGNYGAIPGGIGLEANSYAQAVVGAYNDNLRPAQAAITGSNAPLFVVGNGTAASRSNAFEVSYNGHALPTQQLGNAAAAGPVRGGLYKDNSLNAWGDVTAAGVVTNDFAVVGVAFAPPNVYTVTLNYTPAVGAVSTLTSAAITATIHENACGTGGPGFCTVTQLNDCALGANVFQVRTYAAAGGGPVPLPFFFQVSGR
jgi:hypothetical protein